jgi:hypothetical protein
MDASATSVESSAESSTRTFKYTRLSFPKYSCDVHLKFSSDTIVPVPGDIAGIFGYIQDALGDEAENETKIEESPIVECFSEFPENGLVRLLEFLELVKTEGDFCVPVIENWMGVNSREEPSSIYNYLKWDLSKYGFPSWAISFFGKLSITDVFDMIYTLDFLRCPELFRMMCAVVASYINTLPEEVYLDTFRPKEKPDLTIENYGEMTFEENKDFVAQNTWVIPEEKKKPEFLEEEEYKAKAKKFGKKERDERLANRIPGPLEDRPLIEGLSRIQPSTYQLIVVLM